MGFGNHLRHAHAQAAIHQVLFRHHDRAGFGRFANGVAVERLHRVHVDHARRNALRIERVRRQQSLRHQQSVGDDGDVLALRHFDRLADFELLIGGIDDGRLEPSGADEHRADVRRGGSRTSALVAASSAGEITTKPASEQARPVSSMLICDGPSSPIEMPLCVPTTFRLACG